ADLFLILARTGLRIGEAVALTADDVDLLDRRIRIERTYHGSGRFGPPKGGRARLIDLSRHAGDACARRIDAARKPQYFLFAARRLPYHPATTEKIFQSVVAACGLP